MFYALVNDKLREPFSGGKGLCPTCKSAVIAKCGLVNIHHWSHLSLSDCDDWKENEGIWHRNWKLKFPPKYREVVSGNHRADIKLNNLVIEFQHSPISLENVTARENFWKDLIWVLDVKNKDNLNISYEYCIVWKNAYKWLQYSNAPLILDTDRGLFLVEGKYKSRKRPMQLYGKYIDFEWLKLALCSGYPFPELELNKKEKIFNNFNKIY